MSLLSAIISRIVPAAIPPGGSGAAASTAPAQYAGQLPSVDVEAAMAKLQSGAGEKLDWRASIVDLLKVLGLDSSLSARKELASELGYAGNVDDTAVMDVWLHQQVMQKLAENGGRVPDGLVG